MKRLFKKGWHVLYVKSRQEVIVNDLLQENGIDSFLPLTKQIRQWSDRKKEVQTPLFPSYVFVNIQSQLDFHKTLSMNSACSFVRFGSQYGRIPQNEIDQIKLMVDTEDIKDVAVHTSLPSIGDKLRIEHGDLSGLDCEVYRVDNHHKISVWIESLRQNVSATVPAYYFQKSTTNLVYH